MRGSFVNNTKWNITETVPQSNPTYLYQASRWYASSNGCKYCPYHEDAYQDGYWSQLEPSLFQEGVLRTNDLYNNMYGPCLDGRASKPMRCVQHPAFQPVDALGEYYFPRQNDNANSFYHMYLQSSTQGGINTKGMDPSSYGLGKARMQTYINNLEVRNADGTLNNVLTDALRAPYSTTTPGGVENWMKWTQQFCTPSCHRDARMRIIWIRNWNDLGGPNPKFVYLSGRFSQAGVADGLQNTGLKCIKCPEHTASVYLMTSVKPFKAGSLANFGQGSCVPWFGAVPRVVETDGIIDFDYDFVNPLVLAEKTYNEIQQSETIFLTTVCPVNTYNRKCALEHLSNAQVDYDNNGVVIVRTCTSCDPGWHTDGATGAWFCLPPNGQLFQPTTRDILTQDASRPWVNGNQWRRRDTWLYELECGLNSLQCQQCPNSTCPGCGPSEFNEKVIFKPFFKTSACPSGFYCPDAFTTTPCPSAKPWSPPGSHLLTNCTCAKTTYLSGGTCNPCTTSCPGNQYVEQSKCMLRDGAVADAPCKPCDNFNASTMEILDGSSSIEDAGGKGVCGFKCKSMYILDPRLSASSNARASDFRCVPLSANQALWPIRNQTAATLQYLYHPLLGTKRDQLRVNADGTFVPTVELTAFVQNAGSGAGWYRDTTSCGQREYLGEYTGERQTACVACFNKSSINGATFVAGATQLVYNSPGVQCEAFVQCGTNLYFVYASQTCLACDSVCASGKFARGKGCMGDYSKTLTCESCDTSNLPANSYMRITANGGCQPTPCTQASNPTYFPKALCGGYNDYSWALCPGYAPSTTSDFCNDPTAWANFNSPCNNARGPTCASCSRPKAGEYITRNCSATSDATISVCPKNFYCDGLGGKIACPSGMVTSGTEARFLSECYCPLGTEAQTSSGGGVSCVPKTCDGTVAMANTLSAASTGELYVKKSPFYMALYRDPDTGITTTRCLPCGGGYARGTTFGIESCVCLAGQMRRMVNATYVECVSCAAQQLTCTTGQGVQTMDCSNGDYRIAATETASRACITASPPFWQKDKVPAPGCRTGFTDTNQVPASLGLVGAQGSAVYTTETAPTLVYDEDPSCLSSNGLVPNANLTTRLMAVSSIGTSVSVSNMPYQVVFWAPTALSGFVVYAACTNCANNELPVRCAVDAVKKQPRLGIDFESGGSTVREQLAMGVGPWLPTDHDVYKTLTTPLDVASNFLKHYAAPVVVLSRISSAAVAVECHYVTASTNAGTTDNGVIDLRDAQHALPATASRPAASYKYLGGRLPFMESHPASSTVVGSARVGYFLAAYNTDVPATSSASACGVDLVEVGSSVVLFSAAQAPYAFPFTKFCSYLFSHTTMGLASLATQPDNNKVYLVYRSNPYNVYRTTFAAAQADSAPELLLSQSTQQLSSLFLQLMPGNILGFFALGSGDTCPSSSPAGGSASANCLLVADERELTWSGIEGLPFGYLPSHIHATPVSTAAVRIVLAAQDTIYALDLKTCAGQDPATGASEYWNGAACIKQRCQRAQSCDAVTQYQSAATCLCRPGYSSDPCTPCTTPKFCSGGGLDPASCPTGLRTLESLASTQNQCLCNTGGTYYSGGACNACPIGSFCPNLYLKQACPARTDVSRMDSSAMNKPFPTACLCSQGTFGPGCTPCPAGKICPIRSKSGKQQAALFYLERSNSAVELTSSNLNQFLFPAIRDALLGYMRSYNNDLPEFSTLELIQQYVDIQYLYSENYRKKSDERFLVMITLQITSAAYKNWWSASVGWHKNGAFVGFGSAYQTSLAPLGVVDLRLLDTNVENNYFAEETVLVNIPETCPVYQTPKAGGFECQCQAGAYRDKPASCALCPIGTYYAEPNIDSGCKNCDAGYTSSVGATACVPAGSGTGASESSNSINLPLVLGLGVGGAVVVVLGMVGLCYAVQGSAAPPKLL